MSKQDLFSKILLGLGIASMVTATVEAIIQTPKAIKKLEKKKEELQAPVLTKKEALQTTWKSYILPAALTATGIGEIICSHYLKCRELAAVSTVCSLTETALTEYKRHTEKIVGEEKANDIRESIKKEHEEAKTTEVFVSPTAKVKFRESITGRYFMSTIQDVKAIVNTCNARMINGDDYVSFSEFLYELGIKNADMDYIGFNVTKNCMIELEDPIPPGLDENGEPCLIIRYVKKPIDRYYY